MGWGGGAEMGEMGSWCLFEMNFLGRSKRGFLAGACWRKGSLEGSWWLMEKKFFSL